MLKGIKDADVQIAYAQVNNSIILNDHFDKQEVIQKYYDKWFSPALGKRVEQNEVLKYWHNFESFVFPHEAMPMLKSTFKEIWEAESDKLDRASHNKFRAASDITHRLVSQWQFCIGEYIPRESKGHVYHANNSNIDEISREIMECRYPIVCVNEDENQDFFLLKNKLKNALNQVLPDKCSFEK